MKHPMSSADVSITSYKLPFFVRSGNKDKKYILIHTLWFFWILLCFIKFLINGIAILIMSADLATPSFFKIAVFWNKGYDLINKIFYHLAQIML